MLDEIQGFTSVGLEEEIVSILTTALGKTVGSKLWIGSTRSANEGSWWEGFLKEGNVPAFGHRVRKWGKKKGTAWDSETALQEAYPSWPRWPDPMIVRGELAKAKTSSQAEYFYKLLRLNMGPMAGAGILETLVNAADWQGCQVDPPPEGERIEPGAYWGLDVGGSRSLSSIVAVDSEGRVDHVSFCGDVPDLKSRDRDAGAGGVLLGARTLGSC